VILTTWNRQGGNASTEAKWQTGVADMLTNSPTPPAVICLQEPGGVPTSALLRVTVTFADPFGSPTSVEVYDWGGTEREPGRTIVYHHWDTAGNRVNTAVVSRNNLPHPAHVALVWGNAPPLHCGPRPSWTLRLRRIKAALRRDGSFGLPKPQKRVGAR
jgi:cytolethal distending toxin subunit B